MCIFSNSDVKNKKTSNSGLFCCDLFKLSTNYMKMSRLISYILQLLGVFGILFSLNYGSAALTFREAGLVFSILAANYRLRNTALGYLETEMVKNNTLSNLKQVLQKIAGLAILLNDIEFTEEQL
jgi:hypothetical protein